MKPAWPRGLFLSLPLFLSVPAAFAQWTLEESNSSADLRGIVSVGGGVAWASGTSGTVLRTEDGGFVWQGCALPPGAGKLDFRAIQAWDENNAIVMSSGKGELSRLYRTTDGCLSWKLLFTNPDKDGFWDALQFSDRQTGALLGDPVNGQFVVMITLDGGKTWRKPQQTLEDALAGEGAFAAGNSALLADAPGARTFCTGGTSGPRIFQVVTGPYHGQRLPGEIPWGTATSVEELESSNHSASSGCFALATNHDGHGTAVAVGGDYEHPADRAGTAWTNAASLDGKSRFAFAPAQTLPGGYRSAIAFDPGSHTWIAVGPSGTDVSTDDGKNWRSLKPSPRETAGSDMDWNALSLPFVVGPKGRIAKLRESALTRKAP